MTGARRRAALAAALGLGAAALAGCGGSDGGTVDLPTVSSTADLDAGAPPTQEWAPPQQQVLDRFMAYETLMEQFAAGTPLNMKRLREVATESWALEKSQDIQQDQADLIVTRLPAGTVKAGVTAVALNGGSARVIACVDRSEQVVLKNNVTQSPAAEAPAKQTLIANLVQVNDVWKVAGIAGGDPC